MTVLIGVNDVVQGVPHGRYEANVATILDTLLARLPPERIVAVAIPDYTVTPAGARLRRSGRPAAASGSNNAIMSAWPPTAGSRSSTSTTSRSAAATDRSLVADDGLHPSGVQYAPLGRADPPVVEDAARRLGRLARRLGVGRGQFPLWRPRRAPPLVAAAIAVQDIGARRRSSW